MPNAVQRPCSQPGCGVLVTAGRCEAHKRTQEQQRGSAHSRGYTRQWQKWRAAHIATVVVDSPWCQDCGKAFNRTREIELHHKAKIETHPESQFDADNILHLCRDCHSIRTAKGE